MKKLAKIAGNLLMIAAIAFLVKKILTMDADFSQFTSPGAIGTFGIYLVVQTFLFVIGCIPWLMFTRALSGRKIPYSAAMPVYTRSNLYKYVPGNVFQYVGRNQLAADMKISHVDVACATILDILFCVIWTGITAVILLGSRIAELLEKYGRNMVIIAVGGVLSAAAVMIIVWLKFRDKLREYLSRYSKAFERSNRKSLFIGIFYYMASNMLSAAAYFVCLRLILGSGVSLGELVTLTGAFMFAWIVGFVTPGAPGGIGIREGVMIFVSGDKFSDRIVLFVLVMRIASIIADIVSFVIGRVYAAAKNRADEKIYSERQKQFDVHYK